MTHDDCPAGRRREGEAGILKGGFSRLRRKRLAATCLFLVISTVLLGLQVSALFGAPLTALLLLLAALFAWRVYRTPIPYGWL